MRIRGKPFERRDLRVLGRNIRALREARNWSLRRLSMNSDVSVAAIQKIEAGATNPSLLTMIAVVEALGESIDRLISASRKRDRLVKVVRGELPVRAQSPVDLSPALADRRMHCSLQSLPARGSLKSSEVSANGAATFVYVLDGAVQLSFEDGRLAQLAVGDSFHAAADTPSEWTNRLSRRALVLCIADREKKSHGAGSGAD